MTRYYVSDGVYDEIIEADDPQAAAQEYVDGGDWGEIESTTWIHVGVTPVDEDEQPIGETVNCTVTIHPDEPECEQKDGHDWQSPYEILGGLKENPGVWGHGGGVVIREVCSRCGRYRERDTWAQDPETGEQGMESV